MRLYVTNTSPFARVVRIVVLEKGLSSRIELVTARTREENSPYYAINPSGRVPYLVLADGTGMEDSGLIATYLDALDGAPRLSAPQSADPWAYGRLEARARSFTDGVSVWVREMRRPQDERSPTILKHEVARAERLGASWNEDVAHPIMQGPLTMAHLLLFVGLDFARDSKMADLEASNPHLRQFAERLRAMPSIAATHPAST
ncbi:glutathione S-transferase family protein [Hyphomicrobium sp. CS1BSMeth3]|uniref:glutathione S-transferase family protein n=1 Tax=Hyphomicrobium sp. CS1BSMeth3 TaxID=1892844 RepID=UPI000930EE98|nr:glutathione S-transferase family protein [Hyphomicrobium sp. CS1BSMeth3]